MFHGGEAFSYRTSRDGIWYIIVNGGEGCEAKRQGAVSGFRS